MLACLITKLHPWTTNRCTYLLTVAKRLRKQTDSVLKQQTVCLLVSLKMLQNAIRAQTMRTDVTGAWLHLPVKEETFIKSLLVLWSCGHERNCSYWPFIIFIFQSWKFKRRTDNKGYKRFLMTQVLQIFKNRMAHLYRPSKLCSSSVAQTAHFCNISERCLCF